MVVSALDSTTCRGAEGDGRGKLPSRPVSEFGNFVDDLVVCREDIIGKLDFSDGAQSIESHAHGNGCNSTFCEG